MEDRCEDVVTRRKFQIYRPELRFCAGRPNEGGGPTRDVTCVSNPRGDRRRDTICALWMNCGECADENGEVESWALDQGSSARPCFNASNSVGNLTAVWHIGSWGASIYQTSACRSSRSQRKRR